MDKSRITVMHVVHSLPVGGVEMSILNLAKEINRDKFDLIVCCLSAVGEIGSIIRAAGTEVVCFNAGRPGSLNMFLLLRLARFMKKRNVDVVHTHMYHANLYGRLAAWLAGVPVIIGQVHNLYVSRKLHRTLLNRCIGNSIGSVIAGNEEIKHELIAHDHIPEQKIEIVRYSIDTHLYNGKYDRAALRSSLKLSPEHFVIGNVARLEEAKGQNCRSRQP